MTTSTEDRLREGRRLFLARTTWEAHVEEVYQNFYPTRSIERNRTRGGKVSTKIINNTPVWALDMGAAALFSYLTTPGTYWLIARAEQEALNMDPEVRRWLYETRNFVFNVLTSSKTRFYAQTDAFYHDLLGPGTAAFFNEVTSQRYRIRYRPVAEFAPQENDDGVIDRTFRRYNMPRYLALETFGALPILEPDSDMETELEFMQWVGPSESGNWFRSYHWYRDELIRTGRFEEFPFVFGRYQKEFNGYVHLALGRGAGMTALGDAKMLQQEEIATIRSAQKSIDPTIVTTQQIKPNLRADPGTFIQVQGGVLGGTTMQTLPSGDARLGVEEIKRTEERIIRAFGVDMFLNLLMRGDRSPLKAAEALGRRDEAFRASGALVLSLAQDVLQGLAGRILNAGWRMRLVSPPPQKLRQSSGWFSFEFSSPAALAQRRSEVDAYLGWLNGMSPLLQMQPEAVSLLDIEYTARRHSMLFDLDPGYLKSPEAVEQERQLKAQAETMQALGPSLKDAGAAAKSFAEAGMPLQ